MLHNKAEDFKEFPVSCFVLVLVTIVGITVCDDVTQKTDSFESVLTDINRVSEASIDLFHGKSAIILVFSQFYFR